MQAGSWAHLAFEWTSTSLVTYANGQLVNTAAGTGIGLFNYLHFGNGDIGTISGLISDVRIYNRALSAAQIAAMYNGGK
jgi:hypothetical protein